MSPPWRRSRRSWVCPWKRSSRPTAPRRTRSSLDTPVGDEEDTTIGSFVEDDNTPGPVGRARSNALLAEALGEILGTLTEREADVLRMRFGMYDGRTHTLEEVGQIFGVTRERIRQIENKAIRKLRHPSRAKKIKDFYC